MITRALAALMLLLAGAAASAQVVLFDEADLRGHKLTVRADEPNLAGSDFNDKTQSIVVQRGLWEVCVDAEFRGDCTRLAPGEYRALDARFVKSISSLRPVAGAAVGTAPTTVVVMPPAAPPPPSSCAAGATEACAACRVSCTGGRQAVCKQGTEFPKLIGKPAECAFQSQCVCQ